MRSEERAGRRHDLHLDNQALAAASPNGTSNGSSNGNHAPLEVLDGQPANGRSANGKVSAWEAAWTQRAGSSPTLQRRAADGVDLNAELPPPSSTTNGNGHATHWWPVEHSEN
jgi:hypothetical protein